MLIASEAFWLCLSILPEERVSSSLAHTYTNKIILQNAAGSSSSPPLTQTLPYFVCVVPRGWQSLQRESDLTASLCAGMTFPPK